MTFLSDRPGDRRQVARRGEDMPITLRPIPPTALCSAIDRIRRPMCSSSSTRSQRAVHDHRAGGLGGDVAVLAERDADGRGRQRRGIVDAVAHEDGVGTLRSLARTIASFCSGLWPA